MFFLQRLNLLVMGCCVVVFGIRVCVFLEMGLLARVGMCDFIFISLFFGIGGGLS
jgi:hypothetical protein